MDFTHENNIIAGTLKKIKIEFIQGGKPLYKAKTVRD